MPAALPGADVRSLSQRRPGGAPQAGKSGDPLAPRLIEPGDLARAGASLQQFILRVASQLPAGASHLLAWVYFQTRMCGRGSVRAAAPAVARDIGVSERAVWNGARQLEDRGFLVATRRNGSNKIWELTAWPKPVQPASATSAIPVQQTSAIPVQNCTGSPRARAFSEEQSCIRTGNHPPLQTALIAETDDDEASTNAKGSETPALAAFVPDGRRVARELVNRAQRELSKSRNLDTRLSSPIAEPTFQRARAILEQFSDWG